MKKILLFALLAITSMLANAQEINDVTVDISTLKQEDGSVTTITPIVEGGVYTYTATGGLQFAFKQLNYAIPEGRNQVVFTFAEPVASTGWCISCKGGLDFDDIAQDSEEFIFDIPKGLTELPQIALFSNPWNTPAAKIKLKSITFRYVEPTLPEPWACPEGEVDITTLPWVENDQTCTIDFGENKGNIFGTDSGDGNISYVDITNYGTIKVYGKQGSVVRAFFNRNEAVTNGKDYIFVFDKIGADGVATFDIAQVIEKQGDYEHMYLNGVKAGPSWDSKATVYGITLIEKPAPYTIETEAGKIGTIVLDYPASVKGATIYEVVSFDETEGLGIAEVEGNMVAGTPYIYIASADKVVCTKKGAAIAHEAFTADAAGNGLVGCYNGFPYGTEPLVNCYILANNELHLIDNATNKVEVGANRCFFDPKKCTNKGGSSNVRIAIEDTDATAIKSVVEKSMNSGKIFDINGREVNTMSKGGIYVINGMKVMVK